MSYKTNHITHTHTHTHKTPPETGVTGSEQAGITAETCTGALVNILIPLLRVSSPYPHNMSLPCSRRRAHHYSSCWIFNSFGSEQKLCFDWCSWSLAHNQLPICTQQIPSFYFVFNDESFLVGSSDYVSEGSRLTSDDVTCRRCRLEVYSTRIFVVIATQQASNYWVGATSVV